MRKSNEKTCLKVPIMDTKQVLFCVSIFAILSDVIVFTEQRSFYGNTCPNSIRLSCFISATDNQCKKIKSQNRALAPHKQLVWSSIQICSQGILWFLISANVYWPTRQEVGDTRYLGYRFIHSSTNLSGSLAGMILAPYRWLLWSSIQMYGQGIRWF